MTRVMLIPNELYEDSVEDARLLENWLDAASAPQAGAVDRKDACHS